MNNKNIIIEGIVDKLYSKIEKLIDTNQSDYLQFCDKNKQLDKFVGHSKLVSECEIRGIFENKIDAIMTNLIEIIDITESSDEKYKGVQCLYMILNTFYKNKKLPKMYILKINGLISKETSMKIKFKLMDIIDRK